MITAEPLTRTRVRGALAVETLANVVAVASAMAQFPLRSTLVITV